MKYIRLTNLQKSILLDVTSRCNAKRRDLCKTTFYKICVYLPFAIRGTSGSTKEQNRLFIKRTNTKNNIKLQKCQVKLKKELTVSTFSKFVVIKFSIFVIMTAVIIFSLSKQVSYAVNPFLDEIKTVVLDPGHGGHDNGVQGPAETLEKSVALGLAQLIAGQLKKNYKAILTRSDDYWIDIPGRTAVANHLKADLFISIHTGGSFLHQAKGITIFYYKELSGHALETGADSSKPGDAGNPQALWDNIQAGHIASSKALAQIMQNNINSQLKFSKSKIQNADLMVLKGADMPAILIEVGYLSNPGDEKKLQSQEVLSGFARAICNGIDVYFQNRQN